MCRVLFILLVQCLIFQDIVLGTCSNNNNNDPGEPLYLTPLLEGNKIAEAKQRSRVCPDIGNTTSYSGFFTINKSCESNSHFWFFPAQKNWRKAPVVLWLQGGPGITSISSVFLEVGPLTHNGNKIGIREYSWNVENNLLFIDQPIGTGYSYTDKGCYAQNETDVGRDLYLGVLQFYQLFPELLKNKFFITGQSYAGHFIPALGYTIHKNNPSASIKINFGGMMIGNGWMDAYYQYDLASYLYQLGLIDDAGKDYYNERQEKFLEYMRNKDYQNAIQIRGALVGEIHTKYVGNVSILNYLKDVTEETASYESYIQLPKIRKAIHVGNRNFSAYSQIVESNMGVDPVLSVKPWVEELLEHYFIVFYTGQLDIVCGYPMVVNFLKALDWSGKGDFKNATRKKWCIGDKQVGYFKSGHNLHDVFVRNAEHSVPFGQPFWAYILANTVTSGTPDNPIRGLNSC